MSEENISSIKYANPSLMNGEAKCPVSHGSSDQHTNRAQTNKEWWPCLLYTSPSPRDNR